MANLLRQILRAAVLDTWGSRLSNEGQSRAGCRAQGAPSKPCQAVRAVLSEAARVACCSAAPPQAAARRPWPLARPFCG